MGKKIENRFFQRCPKSLLEVSRGVRNHSGGQRGPPEAILNLKKKSIFRNFFDFPRFFGRWSWFSKFQFWARRPTKSGWNMPDPTLFDFLGIGGVRAKPGWSPSGRFPTPQARFTAKFRPSPTVTFWGPCHPVWVDFGKSTGSP